MNKRKMLMLLSLIVAANSYATLYPNKDKQTTEVNQKMLTEKHLTDATVISVKDGNIVKILDDVKINKEHSNSKQVKKFVNINTKDKGISVNEGDIAYQNKGGKELEIVSIQSGNFLNKGNISVDGQKSFGINMTGSDIYTENSGVINTSNDAIGVNIKNDKSSFKNNKEGIINVSNKGIGININGGKVENSGKIISDGINSIGININKGDVTNNGEIISNDGAIGVNIKGGSFTNAGVINAKGINSDGVRIEKGEFITSEDSKIVVTSNDKMTSGKSEASGVRVNESSNFKNNGLIEVTGTSDSRYSGYQAKGININNKDASAENKGQIVVNRNGIGVSTKGSFTNSNKIDANNGSIGINIIDSGNAINNENITANNSSYGVQVSANGTFENNGTIVVNNGSIGIVAVKSGENTEIVNNGVIEVAGENSTGMQANDGRKVTNNGKINVNAQKFTSGLKATGNKSIAENNGELIIVGDDKNTSNGIIAQNGGSVINKENATVIASGKTTSAMSANGKNSKSTNNGIVKIDKGSIGMKLEASSIGYNDGVIEGNGKGVTVKDSLFVNKGEINTSNVGIESLGNSTVYLKNGSIVKGTIKGNENINILAVDGNIVGSGSYSNLDVDKYEGIVVKNGDVDIADSSIFLEYNKGTKEYLETTKKELEKHNNIKSSDSGNLTLSNSELIIDFKDSLTNPDSTENPIIDVGNDGKLSFAGDTSFVFNSSDGRTEFNINEALGVKNIDTADMNLDTSAIWDYSMDNGNIIAKRQNYSQVINKSQLNDFSNVLNDVRASVSPEFFNGLAQLELVKTSDEFTQGMAQLSGGIHGYTVDMAAINARTLVNTMKNRALNSGYSTIRPINSWTQEVIYLDNNHRLDGLMSGSYLEKGGLGISEKQIDSNAVLGFVYGGSRGDSKFDNGNSGKIIANNFYLGGYYKYDFNDKFSLNSNVNFIYSHNSVTRNLKFGTIDYKFKSTYPTYTLGIGTNAIYNVASTKNSKVSIYAGIDANRIIQGNINENAQSKNAPSFAVRNTPVSEQAYFSLTPSAGIVLQNTGYLLNKKYLVGADLSWETELGNVKDGKRLTLNEKKGQLGTGYTVGTMKRENVISTSVFGQMDLTESLSVNGRYTSAISDEYKADMVSLGMGYKMDSLSDGLISKPLLSMLENRKLSFDRYRGTFAFMIEAEDNSDRSYYNTKGELISGDYATSTLYKPKFTLSLNDTKTNWSYYFEGYYVANDLFKDTKGGERRQDARRIHLEARWTDAYSKGNYGLAFGYRNEGSNKPSLSDKPEPTRVKRGVNQFRLTPSLTYNLGKGFSLNLRSTGVIEHNYTGLRKDQTDYLLENEFALIYKGFMPRWQLKVSYFREDKWYDHSNKKLGWDIKEKDIVLIPSSERYHSAQIRPTVTYYFGNGDNLAVGLRIPIENGAWYNEIGTGVKASETYEMRYSIDYTHVVVPGFNVFGGITILDLKAKSTSGANYGKVTRTYSFRPKLGFSYGF